MNVVTYTHWGGISGYFRISARIYTQLFSFCFQASKMSCYMNPEADPCDQFYEYACGRWELYHPIPRDRVGYDIFEILREVSSESTPD